MAKFVVNENDYIKKTGDNGYTLVLNDKIEKFNEQILGLGNIGAKSKPIQALSVIFDLEGFTNFCKQIDPQLAVPDYLNRFLKWIFIELKKSLIKKKYEEGYSLYAAFPFLSKYLGDGVLFLWNTESMSDIQIRNVVVAMYDICREYKIAFLPEISSEVVSPPSKLRCGIARGTVYSVGDGNDFVGPCINMSARLQKLNSLSFCFSKRGINQEKMKDSYKKDFLVKKVDIRGIGNGELVCVLKEEYNRLEAEDKKKFKNI